MEVVYSPKWQKHLTLFTQLGNTKEKLENFVCISMKS
jgi:hypothetical protein